MNHDLLKSLKGDLYYETLIASQKQRVNGRMLSQHRDIWFKHSDEYSVSFSLGNTVGMLSMTVLPVSQLLSESSQTTIESSHPIELTITGWDSYHSELLNQILNEHFNVNKHNLALLFNTLIMNKSDGATQSTLTSYDYKLWLIAHIIVDDGNIETAIALAFKKLLVSKPMKFERAEDDMQYDTDLWMAQMIDDYKVSHIKNQQLYMTFII